MKTTFRVLREARKYWGIIAFLALAASSVVEFYVPWALRELTALATDGSANFAAEALRIGLLLLLSTFLQAAGSSASGYLNHYGALHYVADLRKTLYNKLQHMSLVTIPFHLGISIWQSKHVSPAGSCTFLYQELSSRLHPELGAALFPMTKGVCEAFL